MAAKPETIQAYIEREAKRKAIYDRRMKGETNVAIARDLGLSVYRISSDFGHWREMLAWYERYRRRQTDQSPRVARRLDRKFQPLLEAGLLNAGISDGRERLPEYGYA